MFDNLTHCVIVGKRGVITIPQKIRNDLGIKEGIPLKVKVENGEIIISNMGEMKNDN